MEIVALSVVCLALGLVIGYEVGEKRSVKRDAPAPVVQDYDPNNPINGQIKREKVVICGREWEIMHP